MIEDREFLRAVLPDVDPYEWAGLNLLEDGTGEYVIAVDETSWSVSRFVCDDGVSFNLWAVCCGYQQETNPRTESELEQHAKALRACVETFRSMNP